MGGVIVRRALFAGSGRLWCTGNAAISRHCHRALSIVGNVDVRREAAGRHATQEVPLRSRRLSLLVLVTRRTPHFIEATKGRERLRLKQMTRKSPKILRSSSRAMGVHLVLVLGGLPLSFSVAFAQTQGAEAPLAPLPAPPSDAGAPGEPQSDAAAVVVVQSPVPDAGPPSARVPDEAPLTVQAQGGCERRYVHNGFYFALTNTDGYLAVWGDGPSGSASITGYANGGTIAIGGSPVPGFAVAGVIGAMNTSGDTFNGGPVVTVTTSTGNGPSANTTLQGRASASMVLLGGLVDWFPEPERGWHVGGSVGLGGAVVTDDTGNSINGASIAGSIFGGYQFWLGPSWSLGVSGVVMGAPTLNLTDSNRNDSGYKMTPFYVGLAWTLMYY
jgi:hypothetical protein